jgi:hypothetical protein
MTGKNMRPEAEWLTYTDPGILLSHLGKRVSPRKRRLYACGCCRLVWPLLADESSRHALRVAERFVVGKASKAELEALVNSVKGVPKVQGAFWAREAVSSLTNFLIGIPRVWHEAEDEIAQHAARAARDSAGQDSWATARKQQVELLCDLLGHLVRTVTINPVCLRWHDGAVSKMAKAIYDEPHFADLPILADVLEDAGCTDADILAHCRSQGIHQRGCWVIDAILGKE